MNAPLETGVTAYVLTHVRDGVATLTLNRGERFNPLSRAMIAALQVEVDRIAGDASVRIGGDRRRGQGLLRRARSEGVARAPRPCLAAGAFRRLQHA